LIIQDIEEEEESKLEKRKRKEIKFQHNSCHRIQSSLTDYPNIPKGKKMSIFLVLRRE
jgi:hypothetical protein